MLTSLAFIFLVGLSAAALCRILHLPRIIGMLLTGVLLGPYVLNLLDPIILQASSDLRQMALIIILLKAGLSLNLSDLKKVGRPAIMMSCVPATCELLAFVLFAPTLLGINRIEAAVMGAVLAAVSPAVVVPRMVNLMEQRWGTEKGIPQMIMAGASCDDIYVIVLFSTFVGMAQGGSAHWQDFAQIPISIVLGVLLGAVVGWGLSLFFETAYARRQYVRNSMKVIVILGLSFLLMAVETWLKGVVPVSGLLAVVSMACAVAIAVILLAAVKLLMLPLQKINAGTRAIAQGEYERRVSVKGKDEISELAFNMNRMAQAVEENIRALQDVAEDRKRFIDNLAHEMKTPLTSILGFSDLLLIRSMAE